MKEKLKVLEVREYQEVEVRTGHYTNSIYSNSKINIVVICEDKNGKRYRYYPRSGDNEIVIKGDIVEIKSWYDDDFKYHCEIKIIG